MIFASGRILELSIAAQNDERMRHERMVQIEGTPPSARRRAAEWALKFATDDPARASKALDTIARLRGLRYIGTGVEYTVYRERKSDTVIKIQRDSAQMTETERRDLVCKKGGDHGLLKNYLGASVVSQTVDIGPHVFGGYRTLRVHQPFVDFTPDDAPFMVNEAAVDPEQLERLVNTTPGLADGLNDFVIGARNMYEKQACLPDTNGRYNVVAQPDGGVTLLDTTPIPASIATTAGIILNQLQSLELGLREVR